MHVVCLSCMSVKKSPEVHKPSCQQWLLQTDVIRKNGVGRPLPPLHPIIWLPCGLTCYKTNSLKERAN